MQLRWTRQQGFVGRGGWPKPITSEWPQSGNFFSSPVKEWRRSAFGRIAGRSTLPLTSRFLMSGDGLCRCHATSCLSPPNCCLRITRENIFKGAGYAVTSLPSTSEALRKISGNGFAFDVVVVCDCAPADERARFIATVKATSPSIPILLVGQRRELLTDDAVRCSDVPQAILTNAAGLLAH